MRKSVASFAHKTVALCAALALAFSMAPLAWADDGPGGTIAGTVAGSAAEGSENPEDATDTEGSAGTASPAAQAPEAETQSADAKAAEGSSAGGTTVSIAVYRSSFPIAKWDLNDKDFSLTEAEWAWEGKEAELPQQASPGSEVEWPEAGMPAGYAEPTRAGFEFAGWSTDKSASAGGYIDGSSPKLTMPEGAPTSDPKAYTLYALWTPNEYSVIFDLSKNPESTKGPGDDASFDLKWASSDGVRTVTDLGDGRYRVDGFTMKEADYDEATRTVGLPEPARSGYRFLGWSEPDGQSLAMDNAGKTGFAMNPVRLTQIDGTPVLTARWTSAFGVTAPLSITFGDYDKTGAPGNPWLGDEGETAADDSTQAQQDKEGAGEQEGYAKGGQAYFENTSWHEAVKLVGLTSTRHANANQVLTTYDTSKASEAQVLGDGTEENPGERLLSLYPSAPAPAGKSSGVHFRLTDTVTEATLEDAFTMAPQGDEGARKEISYGLNLATDPVDGSANHGLVLPTNDYERKQIATVSYTFATATAASTGPISKCFYIQDGSNIYDLGYIKQAADDLSAKGAASQYYAQFKGYLDAQVMTDGNPGAGPYFQLKVDDAYLPVQLIGICQDVRSDNSGKAGLTFQMRDIYAYGGSKSDEAGGGSFDTAMDPNSAKAGTRGWGAMPLREHLRTTFMGSLDSSLQSLIVPVKKNQQLHGSASSASLQSTSDETIWVPSMYEIFGAAFLNYNQAETISRNGYVPFQYEAYAGNNGSNVNSKAVRAFNGVACKWWPRSAHQYYDYLFCYINTNGSHNNTYEDTTSAFGAVPCFAL
ncbi:MAG: hypothetical protein HFJ73_05535 [Eggerthellaceae bacterium]|nr:hypothetical protein [Eggerthellaceae bacterium]